MNRPKRMQSSNAIALADRGSSSKSANSPKNSPLFNSARVFSLPSLVPMVITIGTNEGNENTLAELNKGEFFGELALFDDEPRSANAIALDDCILLGLFTPDLMILQERNPVLGHKIMFNLGGLLGERLRKTNHLLIKEQAK